MRLLFLLLLFISFIINADEVKIHDGSVIIGKITKVHKKKIHIKTDFAGSITIDIDKVEYFTTDEKVTYRTGPGKEAIVKQYDSRKDPQIKVLWTENDPDQFQSKWVRKIWTDFVRRTGNSTSSNLSGGFTFRLNRQFDTLKLYGRFIRNKRKEVKTADERMLGVDFESRFGHEQRHSWYVRAEFEKDRLEDLSLRSTYGLGYGYYLIKNDANSLRARVGTVYREEEYYTADRQSSFALDAGILYKQNLYDNIDWYTEVTYSPAFDATGNYRVVHESGLEVPLSLAVDLTLRSGVEHTYNSIPAEDRKSTDTRYFMRLELTF